MKTRIITRRIFAVCLFGFGSVAFAGNWPISFTKLHVPASAFGGARSREPVRDCQPVLFDPRTTAFHLVAPASAGAKPASGASAAASGAAAVKTYRVEGAEPGETMTINSRVKPDDVKIDLPGTVVLTRYIFSCSTGSSEALVFERKGKPYAIFTHVAQVRFTPDLNTVVFYNFAKLTHHGGWTQMRAIFNIPKRRFAPLPIVRETSYLAGVSRNYILTYGMPRRAGRHATVAVWNMRGHPLKGLSVALHPAANGKGSSDALGLLPQQQTTFYHLARTGDNSAVLRLQDIRHARAHRAIKLTVPGAASEPIVAGKRVQLDLSGLTLKGGVAKYRVSASGKGDDWGEWQTAR